MNTNAKTKSERKRKLEHNLLPPANTNTNMREHEHILEHVQEQTAFRSEPVHEYEPNVEHERRSQTHERRSRPTLLLR